MDGILMMVNNNRVLWGLSMLLLNIGSRYVISDLGKSHEYILSSELVKKLVVMSMFFVATRDIFISFLLTVAYVLIIDGILHEKRNFCLLPQNIINKVSKNEITNEDYLRAKKIIIGYEQQQKSSAGENEHTQNQEIVKRKDYINYLTKLALLKHM